ncbi:unnamed protein product [Phytomonas sp. EM1]|nr:unnamed protein product [Phytomonas sp. EM1]|eukprot:CCW59796.1 unnamed protein product [Phytomonas sp. isolate EM1]
MQIAGVESCDPPPFPASASSSRGDAVAGDPPFLWTRLPPRGDPPPPLCCHSLVSYQDRFLVCFGGGSGGGGDGGGFNRVHVLDLETGGWVEVAAGNAAVVRPRVSHSAVIYRDRMIVYGGHAPDGPGCFRDVLSLDLRRWVWTHVQEAAGEPGGPGARYLHAAHVHRDRMYVLMGRPTATTAMFWYLDLLDYRWREVRMPPPSAAGGIKFPLVGHAAAVEGRFLYVFGGYYHKASSHYPYAPESYSGGVYRYDFEKDLWWQPFLAHPVQPPGRYACAMAVKAGRVFIFGGDAHKCTVYYDDFWVLDTTVAQPRWREVWRGASDRGRPSPRSGVAYTVARDALYILGGEIPSGDSERVRYTNELYRYPLGFSTQISLAENTARWLSTIPLRSVTASLYFPRLPPSALRLLDGYIPR